MKINYNSWFYQFHQYLTGSRDGKVTYNDTNWVDINKRLQRLIDVDSSLLSEQPYSVVGNEYGVERLLSLMEQSGYTFDDIHESLIDTYNQTIRQSMSRQMVNTRAIIYHQKNLSTSYSKGKYYIVDIPFDQLRFGGERDEFIRQKFQDIHDVGNKRFLDLDEFSTSSYTKILNCAFIISINGYICNDVKIGFDDHGLIFKIGYTGSNDAELIIYKLDNCLVLKTDITLGLLKMFTDTDGYISIPNVNLGERKEEAAFAAWKNCIVDIYSKQYINLNVIPNFGSITRTGRLTMAHPQKASFKMYEKNRMQDLTMLVYVPKFFNEVPSIYPAANYMDMTKSSVVYTDMGNNVKNRKGERIITSGTLGNTETDICTPPICIDRYYFNGFSDILDAIYLRTELKKFRPTILNLEYAIQHPSQYLQDYQQYLDEVKPPLITMLDDLRPYFNAYYNASMTTSRDNENELQEIQDFRSALFKFAHLTEDEFAHYNDYVVDTFHPTWSDGYDNFCITATKTFYEDPLFSNFRNIDGITQTFYEDPEGSFKYNQPVSEQCFVSLKYSRDEQCWLFAYVDLKHFHSLGNTFYVNQNLRGNELFKFFVLYSDTDNPMEKTVYDFYPEELILDYDKFMNECEKHIGFIRYWNAENKLMKLAKLTFNAYNDETVVNTISKIMKRKVDASELMYDYDSELHYDEANVTTFNVNDYTEDSEQAPFIINFLFYALRILNGDTDQLQSYFYRTLTNRVFNPRYVDYNFNSAISEAYKTELNFTGPATAPDTFNISESNFKMDNRHHMYYGTPYVFRNNQTVTLPQPQQHTWIAQSIDAEIQNYPLIDDGDIDERYWTLPSSLYGPSYNYVYADFARMVTAYLSCIRDYTSYILSNYKHAFNQITVYDEAKKSIQEKYDELVEYFEYLDTDEQAKLYTIYQHITTMYRYDIIFTNLKQTTIACLKSEEFYSSTPTKLQNIQSESNKINVVIRNTYLNEGYRTNTKLRVRGLYLHLKKINQRMNTFQYSRWLDPDNYDSKFLSNDLYQASSQYDYQVLPEYSENRQLESCFVDATDKLKKAITRSSDGFNHAIDVLKDQQSQYLATIEHWCADIIANKIKDLFIISDIIRFNYGTATSAKPAYVVWTVDRTSTHHFDNPFIDPPSYSNLSITFVPIVEYGSVNGTYTISDIRKPCEYIFFDGTPFNSVSFSVYDETGNLIKTIDNVDVKFTKISSTGNHLYNVTLLPNVGDTMLTFENHHEKLLNINAERMENIKKIATHYEFLVGNHFNTIDSYSELILNPRTYQQGSQDVVYVDNQKLNCAVLQEYGAIKGPQIWFKPSHVMHIEFDSSFKDAISIGGRFTEGQTIWLYPTSYPKYIFPVKITAIDHSPSRGFLEAVVDSRHCNWVNLNNEPSLIHDFMIAPVECKVIDDNLSNFLDEYNHGEYRSFVNPSFDYDIEFEDEDFPGMLSVPGDPIFVQNNAEYVYTRVNWMFSEDIKQLSHEEQRKRFYDDQQKQYNMRYIGCGAISDDDTTIYVSCINHNWSTLSLSEQYPILRDEPNDHYVHDLEKSEYEYLIKHKYEPQYAEYLSSYNMAWMRYQYSTTQYDREIYAKQMSDYSDKMTMTKAIIDRIKTYIDEPEHATTWFNVHSYDAAMKYIDNGRANQRFTYKPHICDIPMTEDLNVMLYDWKNKRWIDPSKYHVEIEDIDMAYDDDIYDDYTTSNVVRFLNIVIDNSVVKSDKILIYIGYEQSDAFNSIELNDTTVEVQFKPLLTIDQSNYDNVDVYKDVIIRKHVNNSEIYEYDYEEWDVNPEFDDETKVLTLKRINPSGTYPIIPTARLMHAHIVFNEIKYDYEHYDLYQRIPFHIDTDVVPHHFTYDAQVLKAPNNFVKDEHVTLISIDHRHFQTNISKVTFEGITNEDGTITIVDTSLESINHDTTLLVTVQHSPKYQTNGGVVSIDIFIEGDTIRVENHRWVRITDPYHILPLDTEFIIIPHDDIPLLPEPQENPKPHIFVQFINEYIRNYSYTPEEYGTGLYDPYSYYYSKSDQVRYPFSTMHDIDTTSKRLQINQSENTQTDLIRSTHLHVCRYFTSRIPNDGIIDVTGYIPTPLSRDRYEFWVNGRQMNHTDNLIILSPTSFQLINLTSLKNFELLELVDDIDHHSPLFKQSTMYTDMYGMTYASFDEALSHIITQQNIRYTFNTFPTQHTQLQNYTKAFINYPNNKDLEPNIMETIISRDGVASDYDYRKYDNIPRINDTPLYYPTTDDLGIIEMDVMNMIPYYDKAYKREILTDPLFPMTHLDDTMVPHNAYLILHHILNTDGTFTVYATGTYHNYFMMYLTDTIDGRIQDSDHNESIIPFVRTGVRIILPKECRGLYLQTTFDNYDPIQLI